MNPIVLMLAISIISGIVVGLITLAVTRTVWLAELTGAYGAVVGALVGYFVAKGMLLNSVVTVPDQVAEQTVSQESIAVEDLKEMTVDEIQELIGDESVAEGQKDYVTIDELKGMTMEEIQELIGADKE